MNKIKDRLKQVIWYGFICGVILFVFLQPQKTLYETYSVNNNKDILVRLPSGMGMNINLSKEDALFLINNDKSGISKSQGKEMLDYISHKNMAKK